MAFKLRTVPDLNLGDTQAKILIVDDSPINRKILKIGVEQLGHHATALSSGTQCLEELSRTYYDAILLDIVMPVMDGFEVLRQLKNSRSHFRDIPVIVVSSLEDEAESVGKAIELGAEDFLPKNFNPIILKARLNASLSQKRFRDQEINYLHKVQRLEKAASMLEVSNFDPASLKIDDIASDSDSLGNLGRVFVNMATTIHKRELAYRRQISLLKGGFIILLIGASFGMLPAFMRIIMAEGHNPFGLAALISVLSTVTLFLICILRGKLPTLTWARIRSAVIIGSIGSVIPQAILLTVAQHLPATVMSITIVMESLFVFCIAAVLGIEKPTLTRFAGLWFGIMCIALLIFPQSSDGGVVRTLWLLVALLVPLCYGMENILISIWPDPDDDPVVVLTLMMLGGSAALLPVVLTMGWLPPLSVIVEKNGYLILLIAFISCFANLLSIYAVRTTGTVFASQRAYSITFAGVIWSMVFLSEKPTVWMWCAVACMICGLVLVRPNDEKSPKSDASLVAAHSAE